MAQAYQIVLMSILLVASAFFSGSETAFFNLSRRQINLLTKSEHRLQLLAAKLLKKPARLLSCFLFGNMIVNVLFFAIASVFTFRINQQISSTIAAVAAITTFCLLVLFGEILPKSLAYANSRAICIVTSIPVYMCLRVFTPIISVLRFLFVEPALRLTIGTKRQIQPVTTTEFRSLIDQLRRSGLITTDENKLMAEIIELGSLKVRDCLRPRVDMIACPVTESLDAARETMIKNRLTKIPVYVRTIDKIVGMVTLRQVLLQPDRSLDKLVQPVHFVPEQKTAESLLEHFRRSHTDIAIVVDEYGGIAGSIRLEDIAEELLGPIEPIKGIEPIQKIGPFEYRLAGNLAIYDWAEAFGIDPEEMRISTIAGLVAAALGKIPKPGDVAHFKNLKFTIEKMQKRRIETVILTLEPLSKNGH